MKVFIGVLWGLGGMVLGFGLFAAGAALYAHWTQASNREGAVGYFMVALGLIGALLGLVAGLVWYARGAPTGEALGRFGQGVLGLVLPGGERHEVFMPPMPRRPDPKAGWSDWLPPRQVFDVQTGAGGAPALLQMRWRLRLYGE